MSDTKKTRVAFSGEIILPEGVKAPSKEQPTNRIGIPTMGIDSFETYMTGAIKVFKKAGVKVVSGKVDGWK